MAEIRQTAGPQGRIDQEIDALYHECSQLEVTVEALIERLEDVLRPDDGMTAAVGLVEWPPTSPLTDRLRTCVERVARQSARIQDVVNRAET